VTTRVATVTVEFIQGTQRWVVEVAPGTSLLHAAHTCGAPVQTLCNGIGACVQCKVRVAPEDWEKLSPPTTLERDRLGNIFHLVRERLGCQARALEAVSVEVLDPRLSTRRRFERRPGQG
jgi:ferredoxin